MIISDYKYYKNTISYSIRVLILYIVLIIYDLIKCGMLVKEKHNIYLHAKKLLYIFQQNWLKHPIMMLIEIDGILIYISI